MRSWRLSPLRISSAHISACSRFGTGASRRPQSQVMSKIGPPRLSANSACSAMAFRISTGGAGVVVDGGQDGKGFSPANKTSAGWRITVLEKKKAAAFYRGLSSEAKRRRGLQHVLDGFRFVGEFLEREVHLLAAVFVDFQTLMILNEPPLHSQGKP